MIASGVDRFALAARRKVHMQRITLANTGITISRIGFGCASLTAHNDRAKAISVLNAALDAGITHFDTARLYGMGHSESILGEFIRDKRDRVTITTKFGMEAKPNALTGNRQLVGMVKSIVRKSSLLNKVVRRGMRGGPATGKFSPEDARQSLETSLRELGTSHVDFFMLHCCALEQAQREDLIAFLESCVKAGTVRAFGPSTEFAKLNGDLTQFAAAHRVFQFESSAATRNIDRLAGVNTRDVITFAPIFDAKALAVAASKNKDRVGPLALRAGIDPTNADALAGFMLGDALARNPRGGVLFATTSAARVKANVAAAAIERTPEARAAFVEMVQALAPMIHSA